MNSLLTSRKKYDGIVIFLHVCTGKFPTLVQILKILVDLLQYIKIAPVAIIGTVSYEEPHHGGSDPGIDMNSNSQISLLNKVMHTQNIFLNHALNGHRLGAGELYVYTVFFFSYHSLLQILNIFLRIQ